MCGIVGYAGVAGALKLDLMSSMRDTIAHRGPDASGLWSTPDGSVVLGHRRLAILDLSAAGAQPMENSSRTGTVVYNGEIYNHEELRRVLGADGVRFNGHSDTEVLLAAYDKWGEECVKYLRGMFAFAIYDKKRNSLFMARDRAGEKPLYWAKHRGGIVFASELKALMADAEFPRRLSAEGLGYYLTFGYVPADKCILEGVHKLMPAHTLSWSLTEGRATVRRYWDVPATDAGETVTVDGLTDELQDLLMCAVREQLVADVPLAVLLSGGIDSSVITAIAVRASSTRVRTFTVTLPKHPRLDERRYARSVAEYLGTDHEELPLDESSVDLIKTLAAQYDEPIADSSMIPTYLLARCVSRHCKVVLGGDGGDELFGGYLAYQTALRRERLQRTLPRWTRSLVASVSRRTMQIGQKGRNALMALEGDVADGIAQSAVWADYGDLARISSWLAPRLSGATPKAWRRNLVNSERALPGAAMATDFCSYLPDDILVKVDRASMLCSLEVRAPFLDRRVVEFAYRSVPNHLRASLNERKILLKKLAKRLLPQNLDLDRKQGFTIPISEWIGPNVVDGWREECSEQIASILSGPAAGALLRRRNDQAADHFLYAIILLTSWMRQYRISV